MTAKADRASQRLGMNLGADDYIIKPICQADLLEAIAARLGKNADKFNLNTYKQTNEDLIISLQTAEEKLNYLSQNDSLTGLLNRFAFNQKFTKAIVTQASLGILIVDLDRFNRINNTKGYTFADALLKLVAERLRQSIDLDCSLARINADEFALILEANYSTSKALAQIILNCISQSFMVDDQEVRINASIGIAFYPQHGANLDTLMQSVNTSLQRAKMAGGNNYCIYTSDLQKPEDSLELEIELYKAIERNQLQLYYQPQVCLETGKITGVEALLRWHHPRYGRVPWHKFIPLAEKNGEIIPIGEWVILSACRQMKSWHKLLDNLPKRDSSDRKIRVAVNLSARQFQQANLGQTIADILTETELDPKYLDLEITESTIVRDIEASISRLNYLKSLGIEISLDDFGTGYSSLSYLQQFPLDTLKIDQGFIRDMASNAKNKAIAIAMIQLGHSMNLKVLAEGVEARTELDILLENHCDLMQGYLFSKALPPQEIESLLLSDRRLMIKPNY